MYIMHFYNILINLIIIISACSKKIYHNITYILYLIFALQLCCSASTLEDLQLFHRVSTEFHLLALHQPSPDDSTYRTRKIRTIFREYLLLFLLKSTQPDRLVI